MTGAAQRVFPPPPPPPPAEKPKRRLVLSVPEDGDEENVGFALEPGGFVDALAASDPAGPSGGEGSAGSQGESEEFRTEASAVWAEFGRREQRLREREAALAERERELGEAEALLRAQRKLLGAASTGDMRSLEELRGRLRDYEAREQHMAECERALEKKFLELSEREARLEQREEDLGAG
jgi:hypothetical protein